MKPTVSIISGIYNVSSFLQKWRLKDIIGQTFNNWELILVDDGSTDDSGTICDDFAKKDSRIKVLHKENGGLGSARNAGLDVALGDYVWFYDVDDEVDSQLIDYCVEEIRRRNVDLLMFGVQVIVPQFNTSENIILHERYVESNTQLKECYLDDILFVKHGNGYVCNKFYRRSLLEKYHLRFENQRIQQDEVFNLKIYHYLERLYISPKVYYYYYIYEKGNTRSRFIPDRFDIYLSIRDHFEIIRKHWDIRDPRFDDYLNNRFYQCVDQTLRFNLFHTDCHWNKKKKKAEMERVMAHPYSQEALAWKKHNHSGLEDKLYFQCYLHQNLMLLYIYHKLFGLLRRVRHSFRK